MPSRLQSCTPVFSWPLKKKRLDPLAYCLQHAVTFCVVFLLDLFCAVPTSFLLGLCVSGVSGLAPFQARTTTTLWVLKGRKRAEDTEV